MDFKITFMRPEDWPEVLRIYGEGIATGNATFETELPGWEKWNRAHRQDCRLIARTGTQVVGWAALSPVSDRKVYTGVAEVSVYEERPKFAKRNLGGTADVAVVTRATISRAPSRFLL